MAGLSLPNKSVKNYRLGERAARPVSERHVVCNGRLIASERAPSYYYNGWYPLRSCSYPGHEAQSGAGIRSFKDASFRNGRVFCDVCDPPDNRRSKKRREEEEEERCCNLDCRRTCVAPKRQTPELPRCKPLSRDPRLRPPVNHMANTYWRYHDPHFWLNQSTLPADANVHKYNWFKREMESVNKENKWKNEMRIRECYDQLKRDEKRQQLSAELQEMQRALKEQQKKASFNNPLDTRKLLMESGSIEYKPSNSVTPKTPSTPASPPGEIEEDEPVVEH
ncbi:uncharacterized protein LOC101854805 [Aplysia californica]|uniref:Uncharacterized protein LOC101854805 n=1 Tax=Aplysia californica TaxID=6500 RepID=A0ABM0JSU7_APLCA|nr:uncharacterized protein LOC101854805 [Aplysia californica]